MDIERIQNELMDLFIIRDFMAYNKYLPIDPRRQAMTNYQTDPAVQGRINEVVGAILKIVEDNNEYLLHSEKN